MVALFVLVTFAAFIGIDILLHKAQWATVLREAPGTQEATGEELYNLPEVGLTMADGKPDEDKKEEEKK